MKILFTGGGSGGHVYPILAVSQKLKMFSVQNGVVFDLYYLGVPEIYTYLLENNGISVRKIASAKIRRYFDLQNFIDIPKFFISIIQAFWKVFWLMPDVLFSKGGTGSFPVVMACKFYGIPIIIHESDSIPGMSNLAASKFANRIAISFQSAADVFVNYYNKENQRERILKKIALVGNPVRQFLLEQNNLSDQREEKKTLGFAAEKPLILVMCGSQGSKRINEFFLEIASQLLSEGYQILHQTGINNFDDFNKDLNSTLENSPYKNFYQTKSYINDEIKNIYMAADLIVSRAGSNIFEFAVMGKPSILVPLPESANGHQINNAYNYAKSGAAIVIEEENLKPGIFMAQIKKIFSNSENLKAMSMAAKEFAKPDAAKTIAEEIVSLGSLS